MNVGYGLGSHYYNLMNNLTPKDDYNLRPGDLNTKEDQEKVIKIGIFKIKLL